MKIPTSSFYRLLYFVSKVSLQNLIHVNSLPKPSNMRCSHVPWYSVPDRTCHSGIQPRDKYTIVYTARVARARESHAVYSFTTSVRVYVHAWCSRDYSRTPSAAIVCQRDTAFKCIPLFNILTLSRMRDFAGASGHQLSLGRRDVALTTIR